MDIGQLSDDVHSDFEVPITVARTGEADRQERAVLHLNAEIWTTEGGVEALTRADMLSVQHDVDLAKGDVVTCSAPDAVPTTKSWVITARHFEGDDHWIATWLMRTA